MTEASKPHTAQSKDSDVLIVGAGPVGLMLAQELCLAGATVTVLEARPEVDRRLRAPSITIRTIQALDRRDLLEQLVAAISAAAPTVPIRHRQDGLPPDLLPIRGGVLEDVLEERALKMGVRIIRGARVVMLRQKLRGVEVGAEAVSSGERRTFRAQYVVGCDGGRSSVRKIMGVEFPGSDAELTGYQAVVRVEDPEQLSKGWQRSSRGIVAYTPSEQRLVSVEFDRAPLDRNAPVTLEEVQDSLERTNGTRVALSSPTSLTRFSGNCRVVARYRAGRVLLAGDAAHVHPPFGGQGLNLGMQDAVNLGWKLAATVQGWAPPRLLDTYHAERHPVAVRAVRNAKSAVDIIRPRDDDALFDFFFGELKVDPAVKARLHEVYSMSDARYPMTPGGPSNSHPLVGAAMPDASFETGAVHARVLERARSGRGILIDAGGLPELQGVARKWSDRIEVVSVPREAFQDLEALLVRPDGHVAWVSVKGSRGDEAIQSLESTIWQWFGAPEA